MIFGDCPTHDAQGAILAHSLQWAGGRLRKGRVLTADDCANLFAAGHQTVVVARLGDGDVGEDHAAARLASALVPDPAAAGLVVETAFTGRVNIRAAHPGVVRLSSDAITGVNGVDPMITVATVPDWQRAWPGMMVATVKIISYAVSDSDLKAAEEVAKAAFSVAPVAYKTAGLIITESRGKPGSSESKGVSAIRGRLEALGMQLADVMTVPHDQDAIAQGLKRLQGDLALILTVSATSDIHDVAPSAVVDAGGTITRFGMPVDPGNLLFLGQVAERPVIGLPGCARSPALNGADWVLERVCCGFPPSSKDIAAMAVGGLLKEIPSRPQPRSVHRNSKNRV